MQQEKNDNQQNIALIIAIIGSFLTPFMSSAINIALPIIGEEFHMNAISLSWVATSYLLAAAICLVPFGKLADMKGRKKIYLSGMIIYTIASVLCAFAPNGTILIGLRLIQGFGGAMIFSTGVAILTSVFPKERRGSVLGFSIASVYIGLSAGPFLGGILTSTFGWRSIFLTNFPLGLVVIILVISKLKGEWAEAPNDRFDYMGSLLYGIAIAGIMYGLSLLPKSKGLYFLFPGLLLMILFFLWEKKFKYPVLNTNLFVTNRVFAFSNLAALINYSATFAVAFLLSLYLQYVKGMNPGDAGKIMIAQPIIMAAFSFLAGPLSDKVESRLIATSGMGLTVVGLGLIIFFTKETSIAKIIIVLATLGLGFGLFSSPNTNAVMSSVNKKYYGVASATLGTMRLTGQMLSMGIAMLIINIFIGKAQINPGNATSFMEAMKTSFIVFAILCVFGVVASMIRGKTNPQ